MKKILVLVFCILFGFGSNLFSQNQRVEISPVEFNSGDDDFGSAITQFGRFVYFTSDRHRGHQRAFFVERTSSGWTTPSDLGDAVNDAAQSGSATLTPDGQYMIFAAYDHAKSGFGRTDLYSARKVNGQWVDVATLGPDVNSDAWDSQPSLSSDGKTLYFSSDRPGGYGGTDIYKCTKTATGWSKPVNLGPAINTAADEMSPVIGPDNKTLYFSSNRDGGLGGFDIYISKGTGVDYSAPRNAGEPINSSADEYFYTPVPNSTTAFFSSNRAGGSGGLDIYTAVPNPYMSEAVVLVEGTVRDIDTKVPLGSDITVTDLRSKNKVADLKSDDVTGEYNVVLQAGRTYSITASKKGYVFYSERYEVPMNEKGRTINKDIDLTPLSGGNTRLLVFFDFNKSTLNDESIPELERIIEFLRDNPNINIQLNGHTDDVGSDDYNDKLSTDRAQAVRDYLVAGGISDSRIKIKGYGKHKPLVNDKTDEARAMNRRVEMVVVNK